MSPPAFLRPECHLRGVDWVVGALDAHCRAHQGAGLCFQIVLDLTAAPPLARLADVLRSFTAGFPALNGSCARAWNLAPYWRSPSAVSPPRIQAREAASPAAAWTELEHELSVPFAAPDEHLRFTVVTHPAGALLGMLCDHRLLDAKGGDLFLSRLEAHDRGGPPLRDLVHLRVPAHLNRWREKFRCGRQVNRAFRALSEKTPPRTIPSAVAGDPQRRRVRPVALSPAQRDAIRARAARELGCPLLAPYLVAFTIATMHRVCELRNGVAPGHYLVPVTVNTRAPGGDDDQMLFNHLSFFIFKASTAAAADFPVLLADVADQFYRQVGERLPQAIAEASDLMRIVPMPMFNQFMRMHLHGEIASFCCSYLDDSPYREKSFMGIPLRNLVHQPVVPPPGIGLFFQAYGDGLNAILAHADGQLAEDEATAILAAVTALAEV